MTATAAEETLDLLKKKVEWGMAVDRNHLFSYDQFGEMIREAEQRAQQRGRS